MGGALQSAAWPPGAYKEQICGSADFRPGREMIPSLQAYDGSDRQSGNIGSNNMVFLARAKSAFFVFNGLEKCGCLKRCKRRSNREQKARYIRFFAVHEHPGGNRRTKRGKPHTQNPSLLILMHIKFYSLASVEIPK